MSLLQITSCMFLELTCAKSYLHFMHGIVRRFASVKIGSIHFQHDKRLKSITMRYVIFFVTCSDFYSTTLMWAYLNQQKISFANRYTNLNFSKMGQEKIIHILSAMVICALVWSCNFCLRLRLFFTLVHKSPTLRLRNINICPEKHISIRKSSKLLSHYCWIRTWKYSSISFQLTNLFSFSLLSSSVLNQFCFHFSLSNVTSKCFPRTLFAI